MPIFKGRRIPPAEPRANDALPPQPPQRLTRELLDWLVAALEAVLVTPEVARIERRRAATVLKDALKHVDHLYLEVARVEALLEAELKEPRPDVEVK